MGASRFYFTEDDVKRLEEQAVQTRQDRPEESELGGSRPFHSFEGPFLPGTLQLPGTAGLL